MIRKQTCDQIPSTDSTHCESADAANTSATPPDQQHIIADILRHMASRLNGELDFDTLLNHIAGEATSLGYAGALVFLSETHEDGTRYLAGHTSNIIGLEDITEYRLPANSKLVSRIYSGEIVKLKYPYEAEINCEKLADALVNSGITYSITLPISYQGTILGTLTVMASKESWGQVINCTPSMLDYPYSTESHHDPFNDTAVEVLSSFVEHAALALSSAILHRDLRLAHIRLEKEKTAVQQQAAELKRKNEELTAVQQQLEAQYRTIEMANTQLASLATTDGMTKLANHRAFQEELTRELSRIERSQTSLSLILLDVDRFKQYNDQFGHPAGDEVLKIVASLVKFAVREGDFPARYGGEEFAVILPDTELETASSVAERIRMSVEKHEFANRSITVSIGVTQFSISENGTQLVQRADVALYEAKSGGRNCVRLLPAPSEIAPESANHISNDTSDICLPNVKPSGSTRASEKNRRSSPERRKPSLEKTIDPMDDDWSASTLEIEMKLERQARDGGLEGMLQEPMALVLSEIMSALDRRGGEEAGHSHRLVRYMLRLSEEVSVLYEEMRSFRPLLPRLNASDYNAFAYGALLHDIGKIGIPTSTLLKRGKLDEEEWRQIRRHPLSGVELISGFPILSRATEIVRSHHERWDGDGYPQGLSGTSIPLGARIFALCDTFDILMHGKVYRDAKAYTAVRKEISLGAGSQFDPEIVEAFLRISQKEWILLGGYSIDKSSPEEIEDRVDKKRTA